MDEKDKWIQRKIEKLIGEGYEPKQAVAVANSMWEKLSRNPKSDNSKDKNS